MADIFVSHSSRDNGVARDLSTILREHGFNSLFLDLDPEDGLLPGNHWERVLYERLRQARAVIALHSSNWASSRWCFAEITHAKLLGRAVIPLLIDETPLDPCLRELQAFRFGAANSDILQIVAGLRMAGIEARTVHRWDGSRCPYPGLEAFRADAAAAFFGRDAETNRLVERLSLLRYVGNHKLVLLTGSSGCGKSSLMLAGVLPRLASGSDRWDVFETIRAGAVLRSETLEAYLRRAVSSNSQVARSLSDVDPNASGRTPLLPFDQLEEVLDSADAESSRLALNSIRVWLEASGEPRLAIGTLRTDALSKFEAISADIGLQYEVINVTAITKREMIAIIANPADLSGIELETGLVELIVSDCVGANSLPLLAYTLREMYERTERPRRFTISLYRDDLAGVDGSLSRVIDAVLAERDQHEGLSDEARRLFARLVRLSDSGEFVRQRLFRCELPSELDDIVTRLVPARILVTDTDRGQATVEVAHESLFRVWPPFRDWLHEHRAYFEWDRRFAYARVEWQKNGTTLSPASVTEWMTWQGKGLIEVDAATEQLLRASRLANRNLRRSQAIVDSLRAALVLPLAWWVAAQIFVLMIPSAVERQSHYGLGPAWELAALQILFGTLGVGAGMIAWKTRTIEANLTMFAVFASLAVGGAYACAPWPAMLDFGDQLLRSLPFGAFALASCYLVWRVLKRTVGIGWGAVSALLIFVIAVLVLQVTGDPRDGTFSALDVIQGSAMSLARQPQEAINRATVPVVGGLLLAGAAAGWCLGVPRRSGSEASGAVSRYWLSKLACVLFILGITLSIAIFSTASWSISRAQAVENVRQVARSLAGWQKGFYEVNGSFASSVDALRQGPFLWSAAARQLCAKDSTEKGPNDENRVERYVSALYAFGDLETQKYANIKLKIANKESWSAVLTSPLSSQLSCRVSDHVTEGSSGDAVMDLLRVGFDPQVTCDAVLDVEAPTYVLSVSSSSENEDVRKKLGCDTFLMK